MKLFFNNTIRVMSVILQNATQIGTHDGAFHCDEALGCWLLKRTRMFTHASITRTRNEEILKNMDAVLDVGAVYDPGFSIFAQRQRFIF